MAHIESTSFTRKTSLDEEELLGCIVPGTGSAAIPTLRGLFFKDKPCVVFFCSLAQNNEKVLAGQLCTMGTIDTVELSPQKYFPTLGKKYILRILELDLSQFIYDADLVSQEICVDQLKIEVELDGVEATWEAYKTDGGGDFVIRGYVSPTTATQCKMQLGIIPISNVQLQSLECTPAEVPAMLISSRNLTISPPAGSPWGLNFLVMIVPGDPQSSIGEVNQDDLRAAVHGILRGAIQMTFSRDRKSLDKKMEACVRGDNPKVKKNLAWPVLASTESSSSDEGEGEGEDYLYDEDEGNSGLDLSGVSGVSKSALAAQVREELDISGEGEIKRPRKRKRLEQNYDVGKKDCSQGAVSHDNWETLELIWPYEERPEGNMRDQGWVDSQPLDTLLRFYEVYERKQKDVSVSESYKVDKKPPVVEFEGASDDCFTVLHSIICVKKSATL